MVSSRYEYPTKLSVRPNATTRGNHRPVLKRALYGRKRKPIGAPRRYSFYDRAMLSVLMS
ncbi:MAG: hypothetical protein KatS3mg054_1069 [Chloroflexus sp.]|nr:MAG: hypothetical protein KatS3mg054_1069 [Chloroflexus sp.]